LDQADIEVKDVYNKTKMDKIIDDVRDYVYSRHTDLRALFTKFTESDPSDAACLDRVVMTQHHFLRLVKQIVGERHSSKDIEQVYRCIVSRKPMTLSRFVKKFTHRPIEDTWLPNGLRIIRDYMHRKKTDPASTFLKFIGNNRAGKINKA